MSYISLGTYVFKVTVVVVLLLVKVICGFCYWEFYICDNFVNTAKLDKLPDYLRDTVDWFMG